jgi:hypothetical protein
VARGFADVVRQSQSMARLVLLAQTLDVSNGGF